MRRFARGVVAMEEEAAAVAAPEVAVADVELAEGATEVADSVAEVEAENVEGEEEAAAVAEAGDVVETLEVAAESLRIAAANGGIDKYSAAAIGALTQHLYDRVGYKAKAMPAMESFGGASTRIGATQLAMEGIQEGAKKIWDSIVAAFKRALQWAIDFYNKIFGSWEKLEKRADALASKGDGITGVAKEKTIKNLSLAKALSVKGTVPANPVVYAKTLTALAKSISDTGMNALLAGVAEDLEKQGAEKSFISSFEVPAGKGIIGDGVPVANAEALGFSAPKDGLELIRGPEMLGGKAVIGYVNKEAAKAEAAVSVLRGFNITINKFDPKAAEIAKEEVPVLEKNVAIEVAKSVSETAIAGRAYRNKLSAINESKKKMIAVAERLGGAAYKAEGDSVANLKAMREVAQACARLADQYSASVSTYTLSTSKALLDLVDQSFKQYGAAETK